MGEKEEEKKESVYIAGPEYLEECTFIVVVGMLERFPCPKIRVSDTGIAVCIPADSSSRSGLNFVSGASANVLRCAFPEHTNNTFMLVNNFLIHLG